LSPFDVTTAETALPGVAVGQLVALGLGVLVDLGLGVSVALCAFAVTRELYEYTVGVNPPSETACVGGDASVALCRAGLLKPKRAIRRAREIKSHPRNQATRCLLPPASVVSDVPNVIFGSASDVTCAGEADSISRDVWIVPSASMGSPQ